MELQLLKIIWKYFLIICNIQNFILRHLSETSTGNCKKKFFYRRSFGRSKDYLASRKNASIIQYGYRKRGTHAQVFSQTLAHGNSIDEIR